MFIRTNCDRKLQFSGILAESLNPRVGLGVILGSSIHSFTRTNGTIKNNPIVPEKEWNAKNTFLKILEQNGKEWNGTDISLKERVKSGTCSYYQERILS